MVHLGRPHRVHVTYCSEKDQPGPGMQHARNRRPAQNHRHPEEPRRPERQPGHQQINVRSSGHPVRQSFFERVPQHMPVRNDLFHVAHPFAFLPAGCPHPRGPSDHTAGSARTIQSIRRPWRRCPATSAGPSTVSRSMECADPSVIRRKAPDGRRRAARTSRRFRQRPEDHKRRLCRSHSDRATASRAHWPGPACRP